MKTMACLAVWFALFISRHIISRQQSSHPRLLLWSSGRFSRPSFFVLPLIWVKERFIFRPVPFVILAAPFELLLPTFED